MPSILVADPLAERASELAEMASRAGHRVRRVPSATDALAALDTEIFEVVVTSDQLTDSSGAALVARVMERWPGLPVVVLVPPDDPRAQDELLRAGATDVLTPPLVAEGVNFVLTKAISAGAASAAKPPRLPAPNTALLGEADSMRTLRDLLRRAANGTVTALIRGETGTGKELAARALHALSPRHLKPFVKIDCASLPDTLLESELFGYERGAFTGAVGAKPGRVELADGGTLFLDEIGEISLSLQAKLLRLLQDREFERLGSRRSQRIDVRFVLATHRDLEAMLENGTFRLDLFHRINGVALWLPPLRARRDDVELLAREFTRRFGLANGKPNIELSAGALRALRSQRWPGNVRQLENFIERLVVLSDGDAIEATDVEREFVQKPEFLTQKTEGLDPTTQRDVPSSPPQRLAEAVRRAERAALLGALERARGNRTVAARVLGVSRATLYNKLKELDIDPV